MHEAQKVDGRLHGDGWFIAPVAELAWSQVEGGGTWCVFEAEGARSPTLGIGIHVLGPGEAPGMYHREDQPEGFLVLSGRCTVLVEGEERTMGPWEYFHCPPGTAHITVGAGPGPCALIMVGTRAAGGGATDYLPEPLAARHGASVERATSSPQEAYAERPPIRPAPAAWPPAGPA